MSLIQTYVLMNNPCSLRTRFRAGVTRGLSGLKQQSVHFMLEFKDARLPAQRGILPAAQFVELLVKL